MLSAGPNPASPGLGVNGTIRFKLQGTLSTQRNKHRSPQGSQRLVAVRWSLHFRRKGKSAIVVFV